MALDFDAKKRTDDVQLSFDVSFRSLLLRDSLTRGLEQCGFKFPSPVQIKAIPIGKCGLDLIVQAKSGTGKTCVFSVIALENLLFECSATQVLVVAPTREIAIQIVDIIRQIGKEMTNLTVHSFVGGLSVSVDRQNARKCQIAVGTPGRLKQMIEEGELKTGSIRLLVLDEADKLLDDSFQEQINWMYSTLPENKQILALSATYPEKLALHLTSYMRNPVFVRLNSSDPALLGIRQYMAVIVFHPLSQVVFQHKIDQLLLILSSVKFHQCLIFSNQQIKAQSVCDILGHEGWPAEHISSHLKQNERNQVMSKLKKQQCKILLTTDLTARGIDAEQVNLVINLDVPFDHETYLHRIGRAGRFGAYGASITIVSQGHELDKLHKIIKESNSTIAPLPEPIPDKLAESGGICNLEGLVSVKHLQNGELGLESTLSEQTPINAQITSDCLKDEIKLEVELCTQLNSLATSPPNANLAGEESCTDVQESAIEPHKFVDGFIGSRSIRSKERVVPNVALKKESVESDISLDSLEQLLSSQLSFQNLNDKFNIQPIKKVEAVYSQSDLQNSMNTYLENQHFFWKNEFNCIGGDESFNLCSAKECLEKAQRSERDKNEDSKFEKPNLDEDKRTKKQTDEGIKSEESGLRVNSCSFFLKHLMSLNTSERSDGKRDQISSATTSDDDKEIQSSPKKYKNIPLQGKSSLEARELPHRGESPQCNAVKRRDQRRALVSQEYNLREDGESEQEHPHEWNEASEYWWKQGYEYCRVQWEKHVSALTKKQEELEFSEARSRALMERYQNLWAQQVGHNQDKYIRTLGGIWKENE